MPTFKVSSEIEAPDKPTAVDLVSKSIFGNSFKITAKRIGKRHKIMCNIKYQGKLLGNNILSDGISDPYEWESKSSARKYIKNHLYYKTLKAKDFEIVEVL